MLCLWHCTNRLLHDTSQCFTHSYRILSCNDCASFPTPWSTVDDTLDEAMLQTPTCGACHRSQVSIAQKTLHLLPRCARHRVTNAKCARWPLIMLPTRLCHIELLSATKPPRCTSWRLLQRPLASMTRLQHHKLQGQHPKLFRILSE